MARITYAHPSTNGSALHGIRNGYLDWALDLADDAGLEYLDVYRFLCAGAL